MESYLVLATLFHISISVKQDINRAVLVYRSLLCSWNHYYENPIYYHYFYCWVTMILKDILAMFSETKVEESWSNDVMQFFMLGNEYTSYFPIITIQLSPLLPKKFYSELFNTNMISILTTDYMFSPMCYCACWYMDSMHRIKKENKYLCWLIVFMGHSLVKQYIDNLRYAPEDLQYYPCYYLSSFYLYQWFSTV